MNGHKLKSNKSNRIISSQLKQISSWMNHSMQCACYSIFFHLNMIYTWSCFIKWTKHQKQVESGRRMCIWDYCWMSPNVKEVFFLLLLFILLLYFGQKVSKDSPAGVRSCALAGIHSCAYRRDFQPHSIWNLLQRSKSLRDKRSGWEEGR